MTTRFSSGLAAAVVAGLIGAGAAPAPAADGYKSCKPVKDIGPTGADPADGVQIRAKITSCKVARSVVRRYTRATVQNFGDETVRVGRYRCTNSYPRVLCKGSNGRRIRFRNDG